MLKKALALMLAGLMVFSTTAFAEEAPAEDEVLELNWSDIEDLWAEEEVEGDFVTFDEVAVKMWVPAVLEAEELDDESVESGIIAVYSLTDDEDNAYGVIVTYVEAEAESVQDYAAFIEEEYDLETETVILNGLEAITYDDEETDTSCIAFASENGSILEFTFYPMSDEDFSSMAAIMIMSIQPEE